MEKQESEENELPAEGDTVLLGTIEFGEAKRIRAAMAERGVVLNLLVDPETCNKPSCRPAAQVVARSQDMPVIQAFFHEEKNRAFEGLDVDHELAAQVFDPEKETAVCPACGTEFSTRAVECPDCGLGFGGTAE